MNYRDTHTEKSVSGLFKVRYNHTFQADILDALTDEIIFGVSGSFVADLRNKKTSAEQLYKEYKERVQRFKKD